MLSDRKNYDYFRNGINVFKVSLKLLFNKKTINAFKLSWFSSNFAVIGTIPLQAAYRKTQ